VHVEAMLLVVVEKNKVSFRCNMYAGRVASLAIITSRVVVNAYSQRMPKSDGVF
jgi:hypothetical protein